MLERHCSSHGPTRSVVMLKHNLQDSAIVRGTLPTDRTDVWILSLSVGSDQVDCLWETLAPDERARAARFAFERDRRRFVVGRGALRDILAAYVGGLPGDIRFAYGEHGKPMLAESTRAGAVEFNASGSEDLAVCAVTVGHKLGVDIELCRPGHDDAFIEQCVSPAERQVYWGLSPEERPAAFYRLWTLKEAYLKATGAGLSRALSSFEVAFAPGESARLVSDGLVPEGLENWTFVEFAPSSEHVGALVIAGQGRPILYRSWSL